MEALTPSQLTGQSRDHVIQKEGYALQADCLKAFESLQEAGREEGLEIQIFSSFRDFKSQCRIWNLKWKGERTLYDPQGQPLDYQSLSETERMKAILHWSALPGTSRHHWGTEIDLYDAKGLSAGQKVELLPYEYAAGGPFAKLNQWMDLHLEEFGFFRPYAQDQGGVQPEPWHISYRSISQLALQSLSKDILLNALAPADLGGKEIILEKLDWILDQYVFNISH